MHDPSPRDPAAPGLDEAPRGPVIRLAGPVQVLKRLRDIWRLDDAEVAKLVDLEGPQEVDPLLAGRLTLRGASHLERVANLFLVHEALDGLLHDQAVEADWLRRPRAELDDWAPLATMLDGTTEAAIRVRVMLEHLVGR